MLKKKLKAEVGRNNLKTANNSAISLNVYGAPSHFVILIFIAYTTYLCMFTEYNYSIKLHIFMYIVFYEQHEGILQIIVNTYT